MFLTRNVIDNVFLTFLISMTIGAVVEYISSFLLEKIFHVRWWDYSLTDKFNLNGRICLRNTLAFGIGGCVMIYFALPIMENLLRITPFGLQVAIAIICLVALIVDTIISAYANAHVANMADFDQILGDQTEEIKKYAKLVIKQFFATSEKEKRAATREIKKQQRKIGKHSKRISKMLSKKSK